MLQDDFKRIVTSFADSRSDIDFSRGTLLVQVRDELIEAKVSMRGGDLIVEEHGSKSPAATWILNRLARLPLLADRILAYTPKVDDFVTPSGRLLDAPDFAIGDADSAVSDAATTATDVLGRHPAGTASVLYLTSDAGEGKTTLIHHIARQQAASFKAKQTDWLIVPIALGGRTFLRFDDVVIAALVNRLRFQFFYFDAFLELVRLGVIVPAFDGFEEMIIEASSGEAISALGNLVRDLRSAGSVLVAARKAYFDYRSFRTQAKLFDAIGSDAVAFARLSLDRWTRTQFLAYSNKRSVADPIRLYDLVAERLGPLHPLITRAVLVRRLVDVAQGVADLSTLLSKLGHHPQDYFFQFINAIVEREANEKWLDQSGEPAQPLLTVPEHHELLATIAQEMWLSSSDALRADLVGVVADVVAEAQNRTPAVARQIRERLKQHALLVASEKSGGLLAFDHDDFRVFYLGEALGRALERGVAREIKSLLEVASLPRGAVDEATLYLKRSKTHVEMTVEVLQRLATAELPTSFVRENVGALVIGILDDSECAAVEVAAMSFPADALKARRLRCVTVRGSYFYPTSLAQCDIEECRFIDCRFERIEIAANCRIKACLESCEVGSVLRIDQDEEIFAPDAAMEALEACGFSNVKAPRAGIAAKVVAYDEDLRLLERVLRIFLRSTSFNESVIHTKLGVKATQFVNDVLPGLLRAGILEEVPFRGSGVERRFRLGVPMHRLEEALSGCGGSFQKFVALV